MQTQVLAVQLELDLWHNLEIAKNEPETADFQQLWQNLEQVIEQSEKDQQLIVAGDAIASIVEVYAIRANAILSTLEVKDTHTEPILSPNFLNDLMRQSMSIDLSDMMEDLFSKGEPEPKTLVATRGSIVTPLDKKTALVIAAEAKIDSKRILAELAGEEQVSQWSTAIANWMHQQSDEVVSLLHLQQALGMPLVDIWLGLLLFPVHQYDWETGGEFYSDAGGIFLRHT